VNTDSNTESVSRTEKPDVYHSGYLCAVCYSQGAIRISYGAKTVQHTEQTGISTRSTDSFLNKKVKFTLEHATKAQKGE
jgi:hypothetical protein